MLRRSLVAAVLIVAGLVCAYAADITGKWNAEFDSQVGPQKYVFDFKVEGTTLTVEGDQQIGMGVHRPVVEHDPQPRPVRRRRKPNNCWNAWRSARMATGWCWSPRTGVRILATR